MALAIAAGRVALGVGSLAATERTLTLLGFDPNDAGGRTLAKMFGGRDLAFGLVTLAAHDKPAVLGQITFAGAALDAADSLSSLLAARDPGARPGSFGSAAAGAAAALAGVWAWRRLNSGH